MDGFLSVFMSFFDCLLPSWPLLWIQGRIAETFRSCYSLCRQNDRLSCLLDSLPTIEGSFLSLPRIQLSLIILLEIIAQLICPFGSAELNLVDGHYEKGRVDLVRWKRWLIYFLNEHQWSKILLLGCQILRRYLHTNMLSRCCECCLGDQLLPTHQIQKPELWIQRQASQDLQPTACAHCPLGTK